VEVRRSEVKKVEMKSRARREVEHGSTALSSDNKPSEGSIWRSYDDNVGRAAAKLVSTLFKHPVRTSKRTPHFTITKINWLTLFNPLKTKLV
jgi:hypothetical protein